MKSAIEDESGALRVLVLSQFYWPERALYARHIAEHIGRGSDANVKVVTGYPNRPGGKIFSGYRQKWRFCERHEGIEVHRVPLIINHSANAAERIANFLSFAASASSLLKVARGADVVYVYATPMTAAIPAQVWKRLFGTPYVLHVQDLWPESVTDSGMLSVRTQAAVSKLLGPWLRSAYKNAAHVFAISPGMRNVLIERGARADSTSVVFNWADEDNLQSGEVEGGKSHSTVFSYTGNLGRMQDLETLIRATRSLGEDSGFDLKLVGDGVEGSRLRELAEGAVNISFLGRVDPAEVYRVYRESDFQLVTLRDLPIFRVTVPSKLQASLASGVPVITTVQGDVARLIEEYGAGIVATPEDVNSLADALERAAFTSAADRRRMGENARRLYDDLMGRRVGLGLIEGVLLEQAGMHAECRVAEPDRASGLFSRVASLIRR